MCIITPTINLLGLSPVFQILASFYVAFIVIEYARSYTSVIANHLFDINGIRQRKQERLKLDKKEISSSLSDEKWNSGKELKYKQTLLDDIDKYLTDVDDANKTISDYIDKKYQFECFRYISIYMFVYCMVCLYGGGILPAFGCKIESNYLLLYSISSTIIVAGYFILGYTLDLFNEDTRSNNIVTSIILVACMLGFSFYGGFCLNLIQYLPSYTPLVMVVYSSLLPSIVFLVGILCVFLKSNDVKKKINDTCVPLEKRKDELVSKYKKMLITTEIEKEVESIEIE